jgi:transcriptional regulator with XRE-family HTH domain
MPIDRTAEDPAGREYARALGTRLRAVRARQHLSLQGVERKSAGRWKAVVVGSYERGDRAVSVSRLVELAAFYEVPLGELLPTGAAPATLAVTTGPLAKVILNVRRVRELTDADGALLARFMNGIQAWRHDHTSETLAIRREDLHTLAMIYNETEEGVTERLVRWQVLAPDSVILDGEP